MDPGTCDAAGPQRVGVMTSLTFARADDAGVSEGFDLDGVVTEAGDSTGCGVADYTDPRGTPGIDNGWARLIPALELTEAAAVEGLIQSAIDSGELLLMFEVNGLDVPTDATADAIDDDCVEFVLERGEGTPSLGTDGTLEWSQTFDRGDEMGRVAGVAVADGMLVARPMEITIPLTILGVSIDFRLHDAALRLQMADDGSFTGAFGGGVDVADILDVARTNNVDPSLVGVLEGLFGVSADLSPNADGGCDRIAITFQFTGAPAFFFADGAR